MSSPTEKDYFGSFLNSTTDVPAMRAATDPNVEVEKQILGFLVPATSPVSVRLLLSQLEIPPSLAIMAIRHLSDAKLVDYAQVDGDETVSLTDLGRRVAA